MNQNTLYRYWPSQYLQIVPLTEIPDPGEEMSPREGAPLAGKGAPRHERGAERGREAPDNAEGLETPD